MLNPNQYHPSHYSWPVAVGRVAMRDVVSFPNFDAFPAPGRRYMTPAELTEAILVQQLAAPIIGDVPVNRYIQVPKD